jgi:hypothetical protein
VVDLPQYCDWRLATGTLSLMRTSVSLQVTVGQSDDNQQLYTTLGCMHRSSQLDSPGGLDKLELISYYPAEVRLVEPFHVYI